MPHSNILEFPQSQTEDTGPYFVKIAVHVIRDGNGNGGQTPETVDNALNFLDDVFAEHDIFFVRNCSEIDYINDNSFYNLDPDISNVGLTQIFNINSNDNAIDIYLYPDDRGGNGQASDTPSTAFYTIGEYWVNPIIPVGRSMAIAHEMGHCLGLLHTFEGNNILADNTNCATTGDLVCDTPPDPGLGHQVNHPQCEWIGDGPTLPDPSGAFYNPDVKNIMSYSNLSCMEYFSQGQGERMQQHLSTSLVLAPCLTNEPQFYFDEIVSRDMTWDVSNTQGGNVVIENNLVINCNAKLTIESGVTVRFGQNAKLIITQGAELVLEGTLTSLNSNATWNGVEVWGNSSESQISLQGVIRAQGRLVGRSGSVIENAYTGVKLYGENYTFDAGGQISCRGTNFINNHIGVDFAPYRNFWPFQYPTGWYDQPRSYIGNFVACQFVNNNGYNHSEKFDSFLNLVGVNGVNVIACDFTNTQTVSTNIVADYGYGIKALDAGFNVTARCTSPVAPCPSYQNSTFQGLGYGISTSTALNNKPYIVRQTDFSNCYFGLENNFVTGGTILFNNFQLGNLPNNSVNNGEQIGVFFKSSADGFTMQENDFIGQSNSNATTIGSFCFNVGSFNNEIRRNNYSNLNYGNVAESTNATPAISPFVRGLNYLCNTNSNIDIADFAVADDLDVEANVSLNNIRRVQGFILFPADSNSDHEAAGNVFSYGAGDDLKNEGESFTYHFYEGAANQIPSSVSGVIEIEEKDEYTCPETYCEPPCRTQSEVNSGKEKFYEDRSKEEVAKYEREEALSSGNNNLAEQKSKEADYYRTQRDKEAFMVVLHIMHDTLIYDVDSLGVWLTNLDAFGSGIIWALSQQSGGNTINAQHTLEGVANRPHLTAQQQQDLRDIDVLMNVLDRKSPYALDKSDLLKIERLTKRNASVTATISRNILSFYGYKFPIIYHLPKDRENASSRSSLPQGDFFAEVNITPNPNLGDFNFTWKSTSEILREANLQFYNFSGKLLHEQSVLPNSNNPISLSSQEAGVYFFRLEADGNTLQTGKFIIQ